MAKSGRISKVETKRGKGFVNSVINKLPIELHVPGYQYCGPGTKLVKRLARGDPGINPLDRACKAHDIAYSKISDNMAARHEADKELAEKALQRFHAKDASLGEKVVAWGVNKTMRVKRSLGMGMEKMDTVKKKLSGRKKNIRVPRHMLDVPLVSKSRRRPVSQKNGEITPKVGGILRKKELKIKREKSKRSGKKKKKIVKKKIKLIPIRQIIKSARKTMGESVLLRRNKYISSYKSALRGAREAVKMVGGKKNIRLPRVLPIPQLKLGGFLPFLVPIFAGLSATGALAGGAAGIAKAVIAAKDAKRELEEAKRHNSTMEAIALGKGLYLSPYKTGTGLFLRPPPKNM